MVNFYLHRIEKGNEIEIVRTERKKTRQKGSLEKREEGM